MVDLIAPDAALGALALSAVILYAAWHEARAQNTRDAKLLGAVGALSLLGCVLVWTI
jgi:hypothetical protein